MADDSFQYRALYEYRRQHGDDISLQPGDLLTVPKASLPECQEGHEQSPRGWLHGTNERTKEKGNFPGTFVEYAGVLRTGPTMAAKTGWSRTLPPSQMGVQTTGSQLVGASSGVEAELVPETTVVAVWRLTEAIEKHGPGQNYESVYRVGSGCGGPTELLQALDSDPFSVDLDHFDAASLADALRGLLLDLPDPIIPDSVYRELVHAAQESGSVEECGERLKRILESPSVFQSNHQLLVHLSRHLSRVSQHQQVTPKLLGQLFAKVIFKRSSVSADGNSEHDVRILEALITTGGLVEMQPAPELVFQKSLHVRVKTPSPAAVTWGGEG